MKNKITHIDRTSHDQVIIYRSNGRSRTYRLDTEAKRRRIERVAIALITAPILGRGDWSIGVHVDSAVPRTTVWGRIKTAADGGGM